jgi:hypothetical protein
MRSFSSIKPAGMAPRLSRTVAAFIHLAMIRVMLKRFVAAPRHESKLRGWILTGTTLVIGYVLIRAPSFHHVDRLIGRTVLGFRWNWILEMGAIGLVLLASQWRRTHAAE